MQKISPALKLAVLLSATQFSPQAFAATQQQLLRCTDTEFERGAYGQYYGNTYHGTDRVCGGDDLASGEVSIQDDGNVHVKLTGANHTPFVLYEVYWIPVGQDPVTHRTKIGNILTDCDGNADNTLRDIATPDDAVHGAEVRIGQRLGQRRDAGNFYFYSRGPWGFTDDGSCAPTTLNTHDGSEFGTLANPDIWGGETQPFFDGVQFISAFVLPPLLPHHDREVFPGTRLTKNDEHGGRMQAAPRTDERHPEPEHDAPRHDDAEQDEPQQGEAGDTVRDPEYDE